MKKILFFSFPLLVILFASCGNAGSGDSKVASNDTAAAATAQADTLMQQVMDGHNEGMAKYGKIRSVQARLTQMLDSLKKLPSADATLKSTMESVLNDVNNAKNHMDVWMESFSMDSAENNIPVRIQYLTDEKKKVEEVKDAILNSLSRADSLLGGGH